MNKRMLRTTIALVASTLLVLPALSACSSSESDGDGSSASPSANFVLVDITPIRSTYVIGTTVTPEATIYDQDGEEIEGVDVEWTVTPDDNVEQDEEQWTVVAEGRITFQACVLDSDTGAVTDVCGDREITSASGQGTVILERPLPGEFFRGDIDETIPVEGIADPNLVDDFVLVSGQTVEVDSDGRFATQIEPRFGVNHITVRAFDGVNVQDGTASASVLWAPTYAEPGGDEDSIHVSIDDAILLRLGQNFLDDGQPYTVISESQVLTEDLTDILELILDYADLNDEIPNPVVESDTFTLNVPDVSINDSRIELNATDTGLELYAQIPDLRAETEGFLALTDETIDLAGDLSAMVSILADLEVGKTGPDEDIHVHLADLVLAVESAEPNFDSDEANAIFELADSMLRDQLEELVLDAIDDAFVDSLPDMILDLFESLDGILADQQFDLDLDFADPLTIDFDGQIGQLLPIRGEGLEGYISAELNVDAAPVFPDNPGVPISHAEAVTNPMFAESRVQLALNLSLLNSILHSLWSAGLLDLDITEQVEELAGLIDAGHANGKLPPVVTPPVGNEPYDLILSLGQLELNLDWMDQQDLFGAHISVGANLVFAGDDIAIEISDDPHIDLWLIESSEDTPFMSANDLMSLIDELLWPELEGALGEGLSFSLPIPELDALEPYAPELADMALTVRMTRPMDIRQGFLVLDAAIEGELFLP